jgi:thiamine biosynthesis protein ThiI
MVALVSGGIDSPVAAWLMMKRGCEIIPVFINNQPYSDEASRRKAMECIKVLQSWAPGRPLTVYEIPDGESLSAFLSNCESRYTCLLCRRMMYRIAHGIMNKENACGIITGSSLGQVASQTAQNMMAETSGIHIPIYHPLIGFDKTEIVDIARNIGTYEPSILPGADCKAVPEKPSTSAKISRIYHEEEKIDIQELLKHALSDVRMVNF